MNVLTCVTIVISVLAVAISLFTLLEVLRENGIIPVGILPDDYTEVYLVKEIHCKASSSGDIEYTYYIKKPGGIEKLTLLVPP